jgi:hypothetical protein
MNRHKAISAVCILLAIGAVFSACRQRSAKRRPASHGQVATPPGLERIAEICVGELHSCARTEDGRVACWGDNDRFQIAPSTAQFHEPHVVREFPRAVSLRCGSYATYVLTVDGAILLRGQPDGKVGTIPLPGLAHDLIVHAAGVCALLDRGRVACGGGLGTSTILVDAAAEATGFAIAEPSAERVCVLRSNSAPVCFDGALWHPVPIEKVLVQPIRKMTARARVEWLAQQAQEDSLEPRVPKVTGVELVEELSGAKELLLTKSGLCGRFQDGSVRCKPNVLPTGWAHASAKEFLATSDRSSCLRTNDGAIHCASTTEIDDGGRLAAIVTGIPAGSTKLAFSEDHGCAIVGGQVKCWGRSSHGQLGDKTNYIHFTPVRVQGIDDATALRVSETLACVVRKAGTLACWGSLEGETTRNAVPGFSPLDMAFPEAATDAFVGSPLGLTRLCAKGETGWRCYRGGQWYALSKTPSPDDSDLLRIGVRVQKIAPDGLCGVDDRGQILCGHCGACSLTELTSQVARISDKARFVEATSLIRGPHSIDSIVCGRTWDKRVRCARVPDVTNYAHDSPRVVAEPTIDALRNVVRVAAADGGYDPESNLVCALTEAGVVYCWGGGKYGQLGKPGLEWRMSAEPIAGLPPVVELGVGGNSACARTAQGEIYCWGSNRSGAVPDTAPHERANAVVVNFDPED